MILIPIILIFLFSILVDTKNTDKYYLADLRTIKYRLISWILLTIGVLIFVFISTIIYNMINDGTFIIVFDKK
jgi:uncharacterized membrane protein